MACLSNGATGWLDLLAQWDEYPHGAFRASRMSSGKLLPGIVSGQGDVRMPKGLVLTARGCVADPVCGWERLPRGLIFRALSGPSHRPCHHRHLAGGGYRPTQHASPAPKG